MIIKVSDTFKFRHHMLTQPTVTPTNKLHHRLSTLSNALQDQPNMVHNTQLDATSKLINVF